MILQTKHQPSKPCGFRKEDVLCVPELRICKTRGHWGGAGDNLNKLVVCTLCNATNQLSKALGLMASDEQIFSCFSLYEPYMSYLVKVH